ncbi:MAG: Na+/H+ antiporter subunit E, partial [Thiobacillus sp.]|nr:Na+/H+ antiporter subunit E [Thiobacillus sp.]
MKLSIAAVRATLWRSALFAGLWWALTDGRADSWGVGSISILAAAILSLRLLPPVQTYVSRIGLLRFLGFFFIQSLRGGAQVAWFALRPRMGLRPGIQEIPLRLPEGIGRVLLTNTQSLLPGTLSVELRGNRLCLHVLDIE